MTRFLPFLLLIAACAGANLAYSTFLKNGLTPASIASDAQGNIYLEGYTTYTVNEGTDFYQKLTKPIVAKVDAQSGRYIYFTELGLGAGSTVSSMAVDGAGNAYFAGTTNDPNFVVTSSQFASSPASSTDERSFLMKLAPNGAIVMSILLGGSSKNEARGIALTPQGQILVSGLANGFPTTPGAYSVTSPSNGSSVWFLLELDPSATKTVFSATGIGGDSLAVDSDGNIYMAGVSYSGYPTTPGAYRTDLVVGANVSCGGAASAICSGTAIYGEHLTKTDATASKLIYSTGTGTSGSGSVPGPRLAVDSSHNVYVADLIGNTVIGTRIDPQRTGELIKFDPTASSVLFSLPLGGTVQISPDGDVFTSGIVQDVPTFQEMRPISYTPQPPPAGFSWVPQSCWPNNIVTAASTYVAKLDPDTGAVQDGQWFSGPTLAGLALAGGRVWVAGPSGTDIPYTPGAAPTTETVRTVLGGGFLASADFSHLASGPVIACTVNQGNFTDVGLVAPGQLLSLFGAGLGPSQGISETSDTDTSLAGVSVSFDGIPAPLQYVSSTQINIAVPPVTAPGTVMKLTVNGLSTERAFSVAASNPNLFADLSNFVVECNTMNSVRPLATNADGSFNSCANPMKTGSTVSLYLHGAGGIPRPEELTVNLVPQSTCFGFAAGGIHVEPIGPYAYKIDIRPVNVPVTVASFVSCPAQIPDLLPLSLSISYNGEPARPGLPMFVWMKQ